MRTYTLEEIESELIQVRLNEIIQAHKLKAQKALNEDYTFKDGKFIRIRFGEDDAA